MTSPSKYRVGAAGVCDCESCRPECACAMPSRPGGHSREACGLADGSVRGARRDEKDAEAQLVKGVA
jgi:hypothetical protein